MNKETTRALANKLSELKTLRGQMELVERQIYDMLSRDHLEPTKEERDEQIQQYRLKYGDNFGRCFNRDIPDCGQCGDRKECLEGVKATFT